MNRKIQIFALILTLVLLLSAFVGCGGRNTNDETSGTANEQPSESTSDSASTEETTTDTQTPVEDVALTPNDELIQLSNTLANGVQGAYTSKLWKDYDITNQTMTLRYTLTRGDEQKVEFIKNTQGATYIENTMDVFVKMTDGYKVYASASSDYTLLNIYRF